MRGLFPFRFRGPSRVMVAGMFTTKTGATPTALRGKGWTIAWVATGRWLVTLDEKVNAFDAILVSLAAETLTGELKEVFVDQDSITTQAFEIRLLTNADTSAGASSLDDDVGTQISFMAVCRVGNHNA